MTKKTKNKFANVMLTISIGTMFIATLWILWEYHRLETVISPEMYRAFCLFWGAEIVTVALRQIFGSDVFKDAKESDK